MAPSLIAAVADGRVIGVENRLPWKLSADLRRFRRLTMGHHLLVGRRTFESIGGPLPGRQVVVISRSRPALPPWARLASSVEEALELARAALDDEPFVAGGAEIYRLALPGARRLYLTRIHASFQGDAFFPAYDEPRPGRLQFEGDGGRWRLVWSEAPPPDEGTPYPYSFLVYEREPAG